MKSILGLPPLFSLLFLAALAAAPTARAQSAYTVTTTADTGAGSLRAAIDAVNAGSSYTSIVFDSALAGQTISLGSSLNLYATLRPASGTLTIDGAAASGLTINGGGANRPFFVSSGSVAIQNLSLTNTKATGGTGGTGGGGGGGGAGLGGAIFVNSGASVSVQNVTFSATSTAGGGGGGGGDWGGGGGGGGGMSGNGTVGGGVVNTWGDGFNGGHGGKGGGNLGGNGGFGGDIYENTGYSGNGGGFGGGGGGGGGGFALDLPDERGFDAGPGGAGGFGGGGASGGRGGYGDSGPGTGGTGGTGGFGGGGGAVGSGDLGSVGGNGGYGGGNGAGGASVGGGGGLGAGGAVFVMAGGSFTVIDPTFSGTSYTVTGGAAGGSGAGAGRAVGSGLFLGGNATINVSTGNTVTLPAVADFIGGGADANAAGGLVKTGAGSLVLSGANSYVGGTTVSAGTVRINNSTGSAFGTGAVTVASGATLTGAGSFSGAFQNNGIYAPGNSPALATLASFNQGPTGILQIELGGLTRGTGYDALNVTGSLTFGGTLDVTFYGAYTAASLGGGESFDLFDWGSTSGTFANVNLPSLTGGLTWDTSALYTSGTLSVSATAVPEPSTYAIIAGVLTLVFVAWRKKRLAAP